MSDTKLLDICWAVWGMLLCLYVLGLVVVSIVAVLR